MVEQGEGCHIAVSCCENTFVALYQTSKFTSARGCAGEREKGKTRQPSGTLSQRLYCSRKEQGVILPALLSPKALTPKNRRQEDLLFPLVCLLRIAHVYGVCRTAGDCSHLCWSRHGKQGKSAPAGERLYSSARSRNEQGVQPPCPVCTEGPIISVVFEFVTSFTKKWA